MNKVSKLLLFKFFQPKYWFLIHLVFSLFWCYAYFCLNPFIHNALFLYPLKTTEKLRVFWCFQGEERGCIGNKWATYLPPTYKGSLPNLASNICFYWFLQSLYHHSFLKSSRVTNFDLPWNVFCNTHKRNLLKRRVLKLNWITPVVESFSDTVTKL